MRLKDYEGMKRTWIDWWSLVDRRGLIVLGSVQLITENYHFFSQSVGRMNLRRSILFSVAGHSKVPDREEEPNSLECPSPGRQTKSSRQ